MYQGKRFQWSRMVKIRAGWVCQAAECGEFRPKLLESHHIKPKEDFPELELVLDNGKCLCVKCHAMEHIGKIRAMIMERALKWAWPRKNLVA